MEITEKLNEGLSRTFAMTVTAEEIDKRVTERLKEIAGTARMNGFRPGKVPISLLRTMYGDGVRAETSNDIVSESIKEHIENSDDTPIGQPTLELISEPDEPEVRVEFSYECVPTVPSVEYASIEIERPVASISDDDINIQLEQMADRHPVYADRPESDGACMDDKIFVSFSTTVDQIAVDRLSVQDFPMILGSGTLFPGFEENLLGAKPGERRKFTANIPMDFADQKLAGRLAEFDCRINAVQCPLPRAIDDDLAELLSFRDLDDLKRSIRENLETSMANVSENVSRTRMLRELEKQLEFDVPPVQLENEVRQVKAMLEQDEATSRAEAADDSGSEGEVEPESEDDNEATSAKAAEGDGEVDATGSEQTDEDASETGESDEEALAIARRRLRTGFLFRQIAKEQDIQVTPADMYNRYVTTRRPMSVQEWQNRIANDRNMLEMLTMECIDDMVATWLMSQIKVTEKSVTREELEAMTD